MNLVKMRLYMKLIIIDNGKIFIKSKVVSKVIFSLESYFSKLKLRTLH